MVFACRFSSLPRANWTRLVPPPVLTGHVSYRQEYACTAVDVLARRTRSQPPPPPFVLIGHAASLTPY